MHLFPFTTVVHILQSIWQFLNFNLQALFSDGEHFIQTDFVKNSKAKFFQNDITLPSVWQVSLDRDSQEAWLQARRLRRHIGGS